MLSPTHLITKSREFAAHKLALVFAYYHKEKSLRYSYGWCIIFSLCYNYVQTQGQICVKIPCVKCPHYVQNGEQGVKSPLQVKELATKYHVSVQTVRRWLRDCLPLRFTSRNPFFDNPELLLERDESLCEKYDVHIRSIRRWKHDYQGLRKTLVQNLPFRPEGNIS